jgi:hypothetical protein
MKLPHAVALLLLTSCASPWVAANIPEPAIEPASAQDLRFLHRNDPDLVDETRVLDDQAEHAGIPAWSDFESLTDWADAAAPAEPALTDLKVTESRFALDFFEVTLVPPAVDPASPWATSVYTRFTTGAWTRPVVPARDPSMAELFRQIKVTTTYQPRELSQPEYLSSWAVKLDSERQIDGSLELETACQVRKITAGYKAPSASDGLNVQVELGLRGNLRSARWKLGYRLDDDSRRDSRSETGFTSHSAVRNTLSAQWQQRLLDQVRGEFLAEYRNSTYKDPNILNAQATRRIDHQTRLRSVLSWTLMDNVSLNSEFVYTVNNSSIQDYDYRHRMISGRLHWQF